MDPNTNNPQNTDNSQDVDIKKALEDQVRLFKKQREDISKRNKETIEEGGAGPSIRCVVCKQLFKSPNLASTCPSCLAVEKSRYEQLRDYLYTHPGTQVDVICSMFNVSRATVRKYLREYKLEVVDGSKNYFLLCERCKEPISTGSFCDRCEALASKQSFSRQEKSRTDFHSKK